MTRSEQADTNKRKYGADYYSRIGAMGGSAPTKKLKGFAVNRELARKAGSKGAKVRYGYYPKPREDSEHEEG